MSDVGLLAAGGFIIVAVAARHAHQLHRRRALRLRIPRPDNLGTPSPSPSPSPSPTPTPTATGPGASAGVILGVPGVATVALVAHGVGVLPAVTLALLIAVTAVAMRSHRRHRADAQYAAGVPVALDAIARSLRSGSGLIVAIREAAAATTGELGDDLERVIGLVDNGSGLKAALDDWHSRRPLPLVHATTAALSLAVEAGTATAQAVDGVANTVRSALRATAVANTHAAQSKASAYVLTALPVVVIVPLLATNQAAYDFLLVSAVGQCVLLAGLTLDVGGLWWMTRLIRRSLA